jgi:hypothetical protein
MDGFRIAARCAMRAGNFYGTTLLGGADNTGAPYKIAL